jgi:hypothetical protein
VTIILPPPPARRLTAAEAGEVAYRARKLLRKGQLTHRAYCLLDCFLWCCRDAKSGAIVVSYKRLEQLAHLSRGVIADGIRQLEGLRLLTRIKRTVRVRWHNGGQQCRQAMNAYVLHPAERDHHEFGKATDSKTQEILSIVEPTSAAVRAAQAGLAAIRERSEARRLAEWQAKLLGKAVGAMA